MSQLRSQATIAVLIGLLALGVAGFITRGTWKTWIWPPLPETTPDAPVLAPEEPRLLKLGEQARRNLGLVSKPLKPQTYWRSIQVPGVVIDRPGHSDRGITAPAVSVVARLHVFPGDTVKTGDRLFTLRLVSEYLQNTQTELFKAARDHQIAREQRERLEGASGVSDAKRIEADNQVRRAAALMQSYRQDLLTRGLTKAQIDGVTEGKFVSEIDVVAPPPLVDERNLVSSDPSATTLAATGPAYEVQELKADLGQQMQAGQTLCLLANHQSLYVEGRGFRRDAPYLEQAAQRSWPVRIEFDEDADKSWPTLAQTFRIRHLANSVDPASRTFSFFLPLSNQSRAYEKDGKTFLVWRFRPGQRVRLLVPVEEMTDVLVLPTSAVAREGADAYVFRQNGDLFERKPVQVLYEDRLNIVLANDGTITRTMYLAQSSAASLNRILKAQNSAGGLPPGAHFHADGSLHIPGQ
jgi:multidrug efflux pump subunit AcrA (membrane-fusion protein)